MSFDINPAGHKPVIRESASAQDGGAGNLGYFEQGGGKEKKQKEESIFLKEDHDSFEKGEKNDSIDSDFSISKIIAEIIFAIKEWVKKIFG